MNISAKPFAAFAKYLAENYTQQPGDTEHWFAVDHLSVGRRGIIGYRLANRKTHTEVAKEWLARGGRDIVVVDAE